VIARSTRSKLTLLLATVLALAGASACEPSHAAAPTWDAVPLTVRSQQPDLVLRGVVTDADAKTTKHVPFNVPEGVVRLGIELDYTGRDRGTVIDTGVFSPDGFRGWSGSSKRAVVLSATDATPAYLPGPIRAGQWFLDLGVSAIRARERSEYTAKVYFWRHGDMPLASTFSPEPLRKGAGWFRGDFHMHDAHSDGFCTSQSGQRVPCPLYKTVQAAVTRRLDFIAITDHNTTSHFNVMHELQPFHDELLLIPGRELTTPPGHANVFGTTEFIDYRIAGEDKRSINDVLQDAAALHGVVAINHPSRITSESCRGCGWTAQNTDFRAVTAIEVANGYDEFAEHPRDERAGTGLDYWQRLLDQGLRLTAIGGSDTHDVDIGSLGIGVPTTVVYARELSERAILDGVRAGHVFVDVAGSRNRLLTAEARAGSNSAQMGDTLQASAGTVLQVSAHVVGCQSARILLLGQGSSEPLAQALLATNDETNAFELRADGSRRWLRIEVRAPDGVPLLIGNPFYLNYSAR
jgi:hypothetical protein